MEKHTTLVTVPFIVVCLIKDLLKTAVALLENLDEKESLDANTVMGISMMFLQSTSDHLRLRTERL